MDSPVRACVFDVGDTLWFQARTPESMHIAELQAKRVAPLLAGWGIALEEPLPAVIAAIWSAYEVALDLEVQRARYRDPSLPLLIRGAMATYGVELTEAQAEEWWRAGWISSDEFGLQLYPDTLDVLRALKSAGMTIGVNTNRPCTGEMFISTGAKPLGFAECIDVAVCSGDTGFVKPHASTFELILHRLGVPAGEVVMVGDSLVNDIEPAHVLGMRTIWKQNGRYDLPTSTAADYVIHDLHEILTLPLLGEFAHAATGVESLTPHDDHNEERY